MQRLKKPIRILVLTSIRDVGGDDRNGLIVMTKDGPKYMMGVVEHAVLQCHFGGALHDFCEIAGVVTDDTEKGLLGSGYPLVPTEGMQWIHPLDLEDHHGVRIADITFHRPSLFRALPLEAVAERREAKKEYEAQIVALMKELGAEVLVSDHYMAKIEHLVNGTFRLYGRVVNIHPAVTIHGDPYCFRGKTPTADAIARAQSGKETRTGATLHLVNEKIDDGPIVHWAAPTPVYADDTPQELRWRNYRMAKLPVFSEGMRIYVNDVLPHL